MTRTVSRLFDSYSQAQAAVEALEQAGFTSSEISLVSRYRDDNTLADDEVSSTATGATAGALVGGGGRTSGGPRPHSHSRYRPAWLQQACWRQRLSVLPAGRLWAA